MQDNSLSGLWSTGKEAEGGPGTQTNGCKQGSLPLCVEGAVKEDVVAGG